MINRFTTLTLFCTLSLFGFSQTELTLNVGNLLIFEANTNLEIGLNENLSVGGFLSYAYDLPPTSNNAFINKNFNFGPEIKYYVNPNNGIDRFYIGLYLKEAIGSISINSDYYFYNDVSPNATSDFSKLALGLQIGSKWVTRNNVVFGLNFGFGRNLYSQYSSAAFKEFYYSERPAAENFDFKFGFNIGYRFQ